MADVAKEHEDGTQSSAGSEGQQEEGVNDPLTRTDAGAPKTSWETTPSEEGDVSSEGSP